MFSFMLWSIMLHGSGFKCQGERNLPPRPWKPDAIVHRIRFDVLQGMAYHVPDD